jgi:hypothetical protein
MSCIFLLSKYVVTFKQLQKKSLLGVATKILTRPSGGFCSRHLLGIVAVLPGVSDVFHYFLVSIKGNSFRTFCFQIEKEEQPIVGEGVPSFKFCGDIYNGTVKSYRYKTNNKSPIVYWVFFEEDQTFVEINSKLILSLLTPLLAPV